MKLMERVDGNAEWSNDHKEFKRERTGTRSKSDEESKSVMHIA